MAIIHAAALLTGLLILAPTQDDAAPQATPPAEATYDLSLSAEVGRSVLIKMVREVNAQGELLVDGAAVQSLPFALEEQVHLVDKFTEVGETVRYSRRFIKWDKWENGAIKDPEIVGCTVHGDEGEDMPAFDLADGAIGLKETLDKVQYQLLSMGLWISLPEEARIGERFDASPGRLIPLLHDSSNLGEDTTAFLTLVSVDAEAGVAQLEGRLEITDPEERDGAVTKTRNEGAISLTVDLESDVISALSWKGTTSMTGSMGPGELRGTGEFDISITATVGKQADKAWKTKVKFRKCPRELKELGLELSLPSHWMKLGITDQGLHQFMSTKPGLSGSGSISLYIHEFGDEQDEALTQLAEGCAENYGGKQSKVSAGLGRGLSVKGKKDDELSIIIDFFPRGEGQIVQVVLVTKHENLKHYEKDLKLLRKSIKGLK